MKVWIVIGGIFYNSDDVLAIFSREPTQEEIDEIKLANHGLDYYSVEERAVTP